MKPSRHVTGEEVTTTFQSAKDSLDGWYQPTRLVGLLVQLPIVKDKSQYIVSLRNQERECTVKAMARLDEFMFKEFFQLF